MALSHSASCIRPAHTRVTKAPMLFTTNHMEYMYPIRYMKWECRPEGG